MSSRRAGLLFIGQSVRSDYCAVHATAMWLALGGEAVSRSSALRWFGVEPSTWTGATHGHMAKVIAKRQPGAVGEWRSFKHATPAQIEAAVAGVMARGWPVLVTALCQLRQPRLRCRHAFVVTSLEGRRIHILDPLSRKPARGANSNAWIDPRVRARPVALVHGASWDVVTDRVLAVYVPKLVGTYRAAR